MVRLGAQNEAPEIGAGDIAVTIRTETSMSAAWGHGLFLSGRIYRKVESGDNLNLFKWGPPHFILELCSLQ